MIKYPKVYIELNGRIFFIINKDMKFKNFIRMFNVKKGSYYYNLYKRLYDSIFGCKINLYKEYKCYYKKEYETFNSFLKEHYNFDDIILEKISNKKSYYKYKDIGKEQPIENLKYNEEIKNIVKSFIGSDLNEN